MLKTLPKIIAHRGASLSAPENTMAAFIKAYHMGAQMFECDVQLSRDHVPVIIHDDTVDRTTKSHGIVYDFSYAELSALSIPSLLDTLNFCIEHHMPINLELKINSHALTAPLVKKVVEVITPLLPHLQELMLVSSFDWDALIEFHQALPDLAIGILVDPINFEKYGIAGIKAIYAKLNALSLNIDVDLLTPDTITQLKGIAPYLLSYTVDDANKAEQLFAAGVDGVFSNNPLLKKPSS